MEQRNEQIPTNQTTGTEFLTIEDFLDSVRRWKWIIISSTVLAFTVSYIYYYYQPNVYLSTVRLLYGKTTQEVSLFSGNFGSNQSRALGNELELIRSRQFGELVVTAMAESLRVNPALARFPLFSTIQGTGNPYSVLGTVLLNRNATSPRALDIINISFMSSDPEEAAIIANILANVYIVNDLTNNRATQSIVKNFIKTQLDEKAQDLRKSENDIQTYMVQSGIVTVSSESQNVVSNIASLEARINESRLQIGIFEEEIRIAREQLKTLQPSSSVEFSGYSDSYIRILQQKIAETESRRDIQRATLDTAAPAAKAEMERLEREAKNLRELLEKRIEESIQSELPGSNTMELVRQNQNKIAVGTVSIVIENFKIEKLQTLLADYEKRFQAIPTKNVEYARLERARRSAEELYLILEKKYQEAIISELQINTNIKVIDLAIPDFVAVEPQRARMVSLLTVLGLLVGLGLSIGLKKMDNRIHKLDDLEKLNIQILGQVPVDEERLATGNLIKDISAIVQEMHRQISININYILNRKGRENGLFLLTTSTIPQEGKTFTGILMAGSLADLGYKVLLIDGDLRRPTVDKHLPIRKFPGLTELILNGDLSGVQKVESFHSATFDVIASGTIPVSPVPLISSEEFMSHINKFRAQYDYIIMDAPPSLSVGDVYIYAEHADGLIYVSGAELVNKRDFIRQYRTIANRFGPKVLGVVLNKVRKNHLSSQGNYYYYYSSNQK